MRFLRPLMFAFSAATALSVCAETTPTTDTMTTASTYTQQEQELLNFNRADFGEVWNARVAAFHEDNLKREPGGIAMVGDSITDWFPLDKFFPGVNVANRGIAGDIILGLIKRQEESIYELKPSKVFLLIGINNIANDINRPIEVYETQYRLLFKTMKQRLPEAKIYIQSVMPVAGGLVHTIPAIHAVNDLLKRLAAEYGFEYLDLNPVMANEKGEMRADYSGDGLHPNETGYAAWTAFLKPYFDKP